MALDANDRAAIVKAINDQINESLTTLFKPKGGVGGGRDKNKSLEDLKNKATTNATEKLGAFKNGVHNANRAVNLFSRNLNSVSEIISSLTKKQKTNKTTTTSNKKPQVVEFDFNSLTGKNGSVKTLSDSFTTLNEAVSPLSGIFKALNTSLTGIDKKVDDFRSALITDTSNVGTSITVNPITIDGSAITVNPITIPAPVVTFAGLDFGTLNTAFDDLGKKITNKVEPLMEKFKDVTARAHDSLLLFNSALAEAIGTLSAPATVTTFTTLNTTMGRVNPRMVTFKDRLVQASKAIKDFKNGLGGGSGGGGRNTDDSAIDDAASDAAKKKKGLDAQVEKSKENLKKYVYDAFGAFKELVDDAYQVLAARGYGTTDSMAGLYVDAAKAGMSLREYAQLMDKNMIAVSRASSFTEFQTQLKHGTDGLKKFGIFGQDANQLAGTMLATAVSMGVPQAKLNKAVDAQSEAFAELRKGSNLTAEAFSQLVTTIQEDEQLNRELANLSVDERIARTKDITIGLGYAKQLGLSESAQRAYTQSVLDHRKTTVKQRFEQAGRISQVGSMVGMGAAETDRMRVLAKNKYRTSAEDKEFALLAGKMNAGLEKMQQGGPGSQFQSDIAREKLEQAGLGSALASGTQIKSGIEAGDTKNKDLNKTLSPGEQFIGESITTLSGAMKNPLAGLLTTAGLQLGATLYGNSMLSAIAGKGVLSSLSGALPAIGKLAKPLGVIGTVASVGMAAWDYKNAGELDPDKEGSKESKGQAKGELIGSVGGAVLGGVIGSVFPVVGTAIGAALGSSLGGLLGGVIGKFTSAETATEKLTRELANNKKALIENTRATAKDNVVSAGNLGDLTHIVASTAKAFTMPTDAENVADFESKKSPAENAAQKAAVRAEAKANYDYMMAPVDSFGTKRHAKMGLPAPVDPTKDVVVTPSVFTTPKTTLAMTPEATVPPAYAVATPPPISTSKSGSTLDVNKEQPQKEEVKKPAEVASTSTTLQPNPVADASQILLQILEVLRNSFATETVQAQLIEQLLRASTKPFLEDNQDMAKRLFAQA